MKNQENSRAGYIGEMVEEFAQIAKSDGLGLLAYLLDMAKIEADLASKKCQDAQRG